MPATREQLERLEGALGNPPFPWQARLLTHFLDDQPPQALDLPTGLGKTSVMAIWLVARSLGASHLPRRLVYIVDRRAVVDQATAEAERLRTWVREEQLGDALGLHDHLPLSTLRGRYIDNQEWLEDPSIPAIVVGTVDMIGSRLLFEGYSCSRKMRPYHAAMLGNDTLFALDEAHLVPPFERLLEQVTRRDELAPGDERDRGLFRRPRLMSLSATGKSGASAFSLDAQDRDHSIVQQRIRAPKLVCKELVEEKAKLAERLAERAWALAQNRESPVRILVFAHRRDDAAAARTHLEKKLARDEAGKKIHVQTELFVGARRVRERQRAAAALAASGFLAGSPLPQESTFLFATSAGEVGVDLDADHMVCDVVHWERMVQRLGRVNRRGNGKAEVVVLAHDVEEASELNDRVLGLIGRLPEGTHGDHDACPAALGRLRDDHAEEVQQASTPAPLYPALERATLDAWSQTSLTEHTGRPEVQPWLRGWVDDKPQTELVWRSLLPPAATDRRTLAEFFEAAPPHASERLEAPTHQVVAWFLERVKALSEAEDEPGSERRAPSSPVALVLDRAGDLQFVLSRAQVEAMDAKRDLFRQLAGTILVVPAQLGGLAETGLLEEKATSENLATVESEDWMLAPSAGERPTVPFRIQARHASAGDGNDPTQTDWYEAFRLPLELNPDESVARWLVVEKWRHAATSEEGRGAGRPQVLAEHQNWAADEATRITAAIQMPAEIRDAVILAAALHDEGKRAARWQQAFRAPPGGPFAKTKGPVNVRLLDGYRHEFGSLPIAQSDPRVAALDQHERDLVLHLIAAHHGFARPLIRTTGCDDAPPSALIDRAHEVTMRFFRLQERFGPWGLAWLETLVRAADQRASRRNDETGSVQ